MGSVLSADTRLQVEGPMIDFVAVSVVFALMLMGVLSFLLRIDD